MVYIYIIYSICYIINIFNQYICHIDVTNMTEIDKDKNPA